MFRKQRFVCQKRFCVIYLAFVRRFYRNRLFGDFNSCPFREQPGYITVKHNLNTVIIFTAFRHIFSAVSLYGSDGTGIASDEPFGTKYHRYLSAIILSGSVYPILCEYPPYSSLYFNGVDSVSISKRLGHAQVSTTANIYAHIMEEADQRNADILSDIFLKKS